jgi:hypothetical protein
MDRKAVIEPMIAKLVELRAENWRLKFDEELEEELGPPCSAMDLARLERALGAPLPPSYRAFMELHDGWGGFRGDAKILAVGDREQAWVKDAMGNLNDLFDEFGQGNPIKTGCFVIMVGETSNWSLFLDPSKSGPEGEMEVALFDWARPEKSFVDFGAFLSEEIARLKRVIRSQKEGPEETASDGVQRDKPN